MRGSRIAFTRNAAQEPGLALDPQAEQVHDAGLFREMRIRPEELPPDPLRSGKLR